MSRILSVAVGALLAVMCSPVFVNAAQPISSLSVVVALTNEGSAKVTQTLEYSSPASLSWKLFSNARTISVVADDRALPSGEFRRLQEGTITTVGSETAAQRWQISYETTSGLIRHNNRDQIFLKIFQNLEQPIYSVATTFSLPNGTNGTVTGNAYAISGVVGSRTIAEGTTVRYLADYAAPGSLFTMNASWSKDILQLNPLENLRLTISNLEALPWVGLGILLPLSGAGFIALLLIRRRRSEQAVTTSAALPPNSLSPVIVGVLVRKKIYPQIIVALLVDLCRRGYIVIVEHIGQFYLSQRKPFDEHLEPWERKILEELFPNTEAIDTKGLTSLSSDSLFSPNVRDAFAEIYQAITEQHFFTENPHRTRIRYKLFGLILYYLSAIGLVWVAVTSSSPFLIIPLAGTMVMALLTIRLTPKLVSYAPQGLQARAEWMAFGNYLAQEHPLPLEQTRNRTFELYLPYAIALGKTDNWARRFDLSSTTILQPDWVITYDETSTKKFVEKIISFTESISRSIASMRGPLVS